jgi:hypothetical protein
MSACSAPEKGNSPPPPPVWVPRASLDDLAEEWKVGQG